MKNNHSKIVFIGAAVIAVIGSVLAGSFIINKEIIVSNSVELNSAIVSAKPGDVIVMKDGIWHDAVIDFNATANSSSPVILRSQTPGNVILDGNSMLTFSKPHLIVDGLYFKNGAIDKNSVINFNSDSCQFTNSAILDYNPQDFETKYYWVFFQGNYNRVDHSFFKGKSNMNPVMGNGNENSRHNKVDHCYIKDIPYVADMNGREIMRIWGYGHGDEMGDDGAYFTVEYNLFERAHGEGTEIVSLKSNYNIVRYNTVRGTRGGLTGRRGKNNVFEGNFIIGENVEGSTGIRVAGQFHRIINNYICDVAEDGLRLIAGEFVELSLTDDYKPFKETGVIGRVPKYSQVKNSLFAHNTVINAGGNGIDIGFSYKIHWPEIQMVLLPESNRFVNNLVVNCKKNGINIAVQDKESPLDFLTFKPNVFEGNIVFGDNRNSADLFKGVQRIDPLMAKNSDGLYMPAKNSKVLNIGVGSDVGTVMDGQVRYDKKDVRADKYSESKSLWHPLTAEEVGPEWIIKMRKIDKNL
jgi:poly(beta-D-mannuronate) lyase